MAHCVHSDEREQEAMKRAGVWAVHCAASNWNLCSGTAPVREMLDRGLHVALGSDVAGGETLSMAQMTAMTIRASKVKQIETGTAFLTVPEALYLATAAGQRYFGVKCGFQPGDKLHAIVVDDSDMPAAAAKELSLLERTERMIYNMERKDIKAVYSEGRLVHRA